MVARHFCFAFLLLFVLVYCSPVKNGNRTLRTTVLPAPLLKSFGRTITTNNGLELVSSASHVGFSFTGNRCSLSLAVPDYSRHNYLQYELDGVYQKRITVLAGDAGPVVITAPANGTHTVWLYKATEAHSGPIYIKNVEAKNLKALERGRAPLIEFIGNSITCGAAADASEVPCGSGVYHDQHNAYLAYGPRVARALGANYLISCVSGIGMYRNWNSNGPAMPQVYSQTDFTEKGVHQWNFEAYSPNIVSIVLGTNDFSRGDGKTERAPFDSALFVKAYVLFVQKVQARFPAAQIALLSSPVLNGEDRYLLQACLVAVKQKLIAAQPLLKPVALFFFEPIKATGCTGHPNVEEHQKIAEVLLPFFRKLLP